MVINETLANEFQRNEQRKERGSRVTPPAPATKTAASTSHALTETPIEPDLNPKKRLLVKSASSAASGSGQQHVKRSATDAQHQKHQLMSRWTWDWQKSRTAQRFGSKYQMKQSLRHKAETQCPVAITTQEGIDEYREKAMRIASVEQVELGSVRS